MPRSNVYDLYIKPGKQPQPIDPPDSLTAEQEAEWRRIIADCPPDYIRAHNSALLERLVVHITTARHLASLSETRSTMSQQRAETKLIKMLTASLRLAPSSQKPRSANSYNPTPVDPAVLEDEADETT